MQQAREIVRRLHQLGNPERAKVHLRFFKTAPGEYGEGDVFAGLTVPQVRSLVKEYHPLSLRTIKLLLRHSLHESRLLALLLLVRGYSQADETARGEIYEFYLGHMRWINNWDLVDTSAEHIVGAHLWQRDRRPLCDLVRSTSVWERRIALLATFYFIRRQDFADTLRLVNLLLNDREDLIHKAAGWMLREIGKRDQAVLETFLRDKSHRMPRTMLRYAIERFPESKRQGYLRAGKCERGLAPA